MTPDELIYGRLHLFGDHLIGDLESKIDWRWIKKNCEWNGFDKTDKKLLTHVPPN